MTKDEAIAIVRRVMTGQGMDIEGLKARYPYADVAEGCEDSPRASVRAAWQYGQEYGYVWGLMHAFDFTVEDLRDDFDFGDNDFGDGPNFGDNKAEPLYTPEEVAASPLLSRMIVY